MKRLLIALVAASVLLSGCGHPLYVGDKKYPTYGLFNEDTSKSKYVCYEISVGNLIWSGLLLETLIAPAYFIGWSLFNPVRLKRDKDDRCTTNIDDEKI